jgi:hypothetical protein
VLLIENEGPREPFRAKLEAKRREWQHPLLDAIFVYDQSWAALRLDHGFERLRAFIAEQRLDLVIGDPLDSFGIKGVGSPEETREFLEMLKACGLFRDVAFWLLHHGRKQEADDELDEIAGAWGGRPDAMLKLERLDGNRARLSFPKLRWSRRASRPALILAFEPDTEGYSIVVEEQEVRDYATEIERLLLATDRWLTPKEIAAPQGAARPGIGANVDTVKSALAAHPERFEDRTGEAAREVGRHPSATVWQVTRPPESPESPGGPNGGGVGR